MYETFKTNEAPNGFTAAINDKLSVPGCVVSLGVDSANENMIILRFTELGEIRVIGGPWLRHHVKAVYHPSMSQYLRLALTALSTEVMVNMIQAIYDNGRKAGANELRQDIKDQAKRLLGMF